MSIPDLPTLEIELSQLLRERLLDLPEGFPPDTNLYEAGLDSMGIMQLLLAIEDRYGILLPEAEVSQKNFVNLTNLATLLHSLLRAREAGK